jgi:hypothetical protein
MALPCVPQSGSCTQLLRRIGRGLARFPWQAFLTDGGLQTEALHCLFNPLLSAVGSSGALTRRAPVSVPVRSVAVLIGLVVLGVAMRWVVPWDERGLEARFGDAYRRYKATVPRWLGGARR